MNTPHPDDAPARKPSGGPMTDLLFADLDLEAMWHAWAVEPPEPEPLAAPCAA